MLLLQLITAAVLIAAVLLVIANAGTWQSRLEHYLAGGLNLLKQTAVSIEKAVPMFKRLNLSEHIDHDAQQFTDQFAVKNFLPITLLLVKWLPSLLLVPYLTYFMLSDSARLKKYLIRSVPNAFFEKALLLFSRLDASLHNYFRGLVTLTLLDTISLALSLKMLGVGNPVWFGLVAAVLAWIPYIGSAIGYVLTLALPSVRSPDHSSFPPSTTPILNHVRNSKELSVLNLVEEFTRAEFSANIFRVKRNDIRSSRTS